MQDVILLWGRPSPRLPRTMSMRRPPIIRNQDAALSYRLIDVAIGETMFILRKALSRVVVVISTFTRVKMLRDVRNG